MRFLEQQLVDESLETTLQQESTKINNKQKFTNVLMKWPNLDINYSEFIILKEFESQLSEEQLINQFSTYKAIVKLIQEQMVNNRESFLSKINQYYEEYFVKRYGNVLTQYQGFQVQSFTKIMHDIKLFSGYFTNLLQTLYQFDQKYLNQPLLKKLLNEYNLRNFIIALLFESTKISDIIINLQKQLDENLINRITKNLLNSNLKQNGGPQDFSVPLTFCLNRFTFETATPTTTPLQIASPYEEIIKMLNEIPKIKNPLAKYKQLMDTGYFIKQNIIAFYSQLNLEPPEEIDQDDAITIYIYLFIKSEFKEIYSHFNIIEKFVHPNIKGYIDDPSFSYFTIHSCIDYIERSFKK